MKDIKLAAAVLAGGKGSRLNMDKSLLKLNNIPLLDKIIAKLNLISNDIAIISSKKEIKNRFPFLPCYKDIYVGCGPLAGIHAALTNTNSDYLFVCACDMPNLNVLIIEKLIKSMSISEADIIVPRHAEGIEPLHAIYSKRCLTYIEHQLNENICSIRNFYKLVEVDYVDFNLDEIQYFYNINTHHDLKNFKPTI
ncbi:molybdenum cofactor guanylyltransferase [Candidatus Cloacimonadota bacterium]